MNNQEALVKAQEFLIQEISLEPCACPFYSREPMQFEAIFLIRASWELPYIGGSPYLFIPSEGKPYIKWEGE